MQYPYRVSADDADISPTTSYHRNAEGAENAILKLLRAGRSPVRVTYLRRALVSFASGEYAPAEGERFVIYPAWFLLTGEAGYRAREEVWQANGSPVKDGVPDMPRCDTPGEYMRALIHNLGIVEALPRGKAQRNAAEALVSQFGMPEADALKIVGALKGYLK